MSSKASGISLPDVGELSRRFEGAIAFIFKGGVSIVDLFTIDAYYRQIDDGDTAENLDL